MVSGGEVTGEVLEMPRMLAVPNLNDPGSCYRYCREVTHRYGPNFSIGFRFLPREKRNAVYATYAFCRFADDIADEAGRSEPPKLLDAWERSLERCYAGFADHPILVALADAVRKFPIQARSFQRLIEGCRMDLAISRYRTFGDLLVYCDRVATTISEMSLAIFGWDDPRTQEWGEHLSTALQLTNIVRDVAEDYRRGRVYLPQEDLERFQCPESALAGPPARPEFVELMEFQVGRIEDYFARARPLASAVRQDSRVALALMGGVYERIARKIGSDVRAVLSRRVVLTPREKMSLILAMWVRGWMHWTGLAPPPAW
jgi:phytoene synthase